MSVDRLQRILRARWWALVLIALFSILVANQLTAFRNDRLPAREAVATVTFQRLLGELTDEGRLTRLANAESVAIDVNITKLAERLHPLAPWELATIEIDTRTFELLFTGRGNTDEEATIRVDSMLARFFEEEPFTGILGIQGQLDALANEIITVERNIAEAVAAEPTPELTAADHIAAAELAALDAQIGALVAQHNALKIELINPIPPDPFAIQRSSAAIQADVDRVVNLLIGLQIERQAMASEIEESGRPIDTAAPGSPDAEGVATPPDVVVLKPEPFSEAEFVDQISVEFWSLQSEQLRLAYQNLFLRQVEAQRLVTVSSEVELGSSSLQAADALANQALAIAAGLLVGLGGLIIADRVRKPLWEASDVEGLPQLPEVGPRGRFDPLDAPWYMATGSVARKAGIQALRATIEGVAQTDTAVVGVTGLQAEAEDVQELAADLATSIAASGNSVLLVDANLEHPSELVEYGDGFVNLSGLLLEVQLIDEAAGQSTQDHYHEKLAALSPVIPNLYSMAAGTKAADGPDIMARPHFGLLIQDAADRFDVVIVSGAGIKSPITQVLSQRLGHMVLAAAAGRATESDVDLVRREYGYRKAKLLGIALLMNTPTRVGRRFWRLFRRTRESSVPSWRLGRPTTRTTQSAPSGQADRHAGQGKPIEPVIYHTRWRKPAAVGGSDGWTQGPEFESAEAARSWAQGSAELNGASVVEIYTDEPTGARAVETIEPSTLSAPEEKAAAERVAAEKRVAERVAAERVAAERVAAERVAAERVAEEKRVAAEKRVAERVAAEKRVAERVAAEKRVAERVAAEKRVAAERVAAERVAADEKAVGVGVAASEMAAAPKSATVVVEVPAGTKPARHAAKKPAAKKPAAKKPAAKKPAAKKPAAKKPAAKKPAAKKPAAKKPAAKKPAAKAKKTLSAGATPSSPPSAGSESNDLAMVNGIGPVYVERLIAAGYDSLAALAAGDAEALSSAAGVSTDTARRWAKAAAAL